MVTDTAAASRTDHLRRGLRLEYFTVGWNLVEGVVAVAAALAAGSVALLGFGIDSFVECLSGGVLIWRLLAERHGSGNAEHLHRLERRAQLLVATSLAALAVFIAGDAVQTLWRGERPDQSVVGIVVTVVSLGVMWWLAKSKREVAVRLGSRAMQADAFQTTACWWLSLMALIGVGLNTMLGWWWADPLAALGITVMLVREAQSAWRGEDCC